MLKVTQLSGFGAGGGGAAPTRAVLSFVNSTHNSGTDTINIHADRQAGDLLVCFNGGLQLTDYPTTVVPSGFTSLANETFTQDSYFGKAIISYKISTGDETGTFYVMDAANYSYQTIGIFRKSTLIDSLTWNTHTFDHVDDTVNPASQDIVPNNTGRLGIAFGWYFASGTALDTPTMSPAATGSFGPGATTFLVNYKFFNDNDHATVTIDADASSGTFGTTMAGTYVSLA